MRRLKQWLIERYFPAEAKETVAKLQSTILQKNMEIARLNAYIDGLESGMRSQRRIVINNSTQSKG